MHNLFKSLPYYEAIEPHLDVFVPEKQTQGSLYAAQDDRIRAVRDGTHLFVDGVANKMVALCAVSST